MIGNSFSPLLGAVGGAGGGIPSMTTNSSETGDLGVGANFGANFKGDMNLNSSSWKQYFVAGGLAVAFVVILATLKKKGVI